MHYKISDNSIFAQDKGQFRIDRAGDRMTRRIHPAPGRCDSDGERLLPREAPGSTRYARTCGQARSTWNAATLRASLLNSTAMRWIARPEPRYLSA